MVTKADTFEGMVTKAEYELIYDQQKSVWSGNGIGYRLPKDSDVRMYSAHPIPPDYNFEGLTSAIERTIE